MATFPAKTNYAAGNVLTAAQMVDIGEQINALNGNAGKNKLINGDFNIWQRGTSVSITTTFQYLADRWQSIVGFGSPVGTMSQQAFTAGTAPVAGYESQYFLRLNLTTGPGGANPVAIGQRVEDVRTFAGQTVTLSFWAKADTTRSWYTRLIQNFGSGGSADVLTTGDTKTVTTSWQRFTQTFTVPSISGKTIGAGNYLYVLIYGPDSVAQTMDIWGVQLEAGNVATSFQTATGTLAGELAACQRYYVRLNGEAANSSHAMGIAYSTTGCSVNYQLPVSMRTYPTAVEYSALRLTENVNAYNVTNLTLSTDKGTLTCINCTISVASGLTQFRSYLLTGVNTPNYVGFSAEL